jgi:hypothetical protein
VSGSRSRESPPFIETKVLLHFASVTSRFLQMNQRQFPGSKPAAEVAVQHVRLIKNVYRCGAEIVLEGVLSRNA